MSALDKESSLITRFIRKLRGGSQPILAQASDGITYVVKLNKSLQGRNVAFNEAMGTGLYCAVGLPVPVWKPLILTEEFLDQNSKCWFETTEGLLRPEPGLCFGSRYLSGDGVRLWEILPRSSFSQILNSGDFYLAWLLDICASHTENRQAVFDVQPHGIHAIFLDHGHMFSGPDGISVRPNFRASAYLDTRIYEWSRISCGANMAKIVSNMDMDALWRKAERLPKEWLTDTALRGFAECLGKLADAKVVQSVVEMMVGFPGEIDQRESLANEQRRRFSDWLLRAGVQGA